jgi:branched-chain amino acid transport system substrate-binding protein
MLFVLVLVSCSAVWLWSVTHPAVPAPEVPSNKPVVVTLGIISDSTEMKRHFDHIANTTLTEVNAYAASKDSQIRFDYRSEQADNIYGLEAVGKMKKEFGVNIFLGFDYSEAMCASLSYANSAHLILMGVPLIHHSSTALPNDVMFRIAPNLRQVHDVVVSLVERIGFDGVLVIWRGDSWGDGVEYSLSEVLGEDSIRTVRYDKTTVNYTETIELAASELRSLNERFGSEHTAVLLVCTGEGQTILSEAGRREGLLEVPWIVLEESVDPYSVEGDLPDISGVASADVAKAKLISVKIAPLTSNDNFTRLQSRYVATRPPAEDKPFGVMEASFYDSVWVACLSVLKANTTDANILKEMIPTIVQEYTGASGNVVLDVNGDRTVDYDVYQASDVGGTVDWVKIGRYGAVTGQMILDVKLP